MKFTDYRHINAKIDDNFLGGITLRIDVDQDDEELKVSWALCNPNDQFCRKTGRQLADRKMEEGVFLTGQYNRSLSLKENAALHLSNEVHRMSNPSTSSKVRRDIEKVLKRWDSINFINDGTIYDC